MWHLLTAGLALPVMAAAFPSIHSLGEQHGSWLPVKTVYEPDVIVTVMVTETAHVTCEACMAASAFGAEFVGVISSQTASATQSTTSAMFSEPAGPAITLVPTVHWNQDTTNLSNLVPSATGDVYYASADSGSEYTEISMGHHSSVWQALINPINSLGSTRPSRLRRLSWITRASSTILGLATRTHSR